MSLTSFLRPLLSRMDYTILGWASCWCSEAGPGAGLRTPATGPPGRQAGLAGWAQLPHHPVPFLCQAAPPSHAPTSWPPPTPSPQAGEGSDV